MSQNPDAIRSDIERTRERLGYDVDAVADKVSPSHIAHRQGERIKGAVSDMKEKVMGSADDAAGSMESATHRVGDAVDNTQRRVVRKTQGNPLAAGLVAFGTGLLVASLFPPSEKEQELAQTLQEKAEPLKEELSAAASHVASQLKEPAREAVESVKQTATEGVESVKGEAQNQSSSVQDRVQEAKRNVSES
ncbi:DUF3618 domain-containing protein [Sinomonas notoginsengisoli]|uniref:DUF3618 domain-containing protein n=1 Tax=Sinomonas notoginsengisoli TaxID=1457311 RepID=UPI001F2A4CAA|nr:DUF3618 domain-containing protein [Sinomonas notoginsengisoli]